MENVVDQVITAYPFYQVFISLLDILIVSLIFYAILTVVGNNTKTLRIFKGAIVVIIIDLVAKTLNLSTLQTLSQNLINWGFLVFIIVFQPEIRSFLERIGKTSLNNYSLVSLDITNKVIDEITSAIIDLSESKTGAIITIERNVSLNDFVKSGVPIYADITHELIKTIFKTNTPLHDGAIIIQGDKISCASTYFPPPTIEVLQSFGSRHRAAFGISEITDSLTIVVSEETGMIRIVEYGEATIVRSSDFKEALVKHLTSTKVDKESEVSNNG